MSWIFWVLAAITIAGAMATVLVHRLVHAALGAAVAFVGLALLFLSLDAQFAFKCAAFQRLVLLNALPFSA